jgi:tetratricopeptide (TPR) repeat protein
MADPLDRLKVALADRYALERELGRGGMATVYLARDRKHDRLVALKVLRPELAHTLGPDRFLREIALTAQLQHPLILPLLDSGEADGTLYYVMPYVEGESLRDRLDRERQLPLEEALQIAREVAEALGNAHSRGVIHRDIKPENVLLAGGRAVVADFGIAKAVTEAGGAKLTETGLAIGTPAYMSPEQAAGVGRVDARSDLYSLGCVLYEMLAGHPPFQGSTAHELIARHATDPVPPLKAARKTIPEGIEAAIERALEKTPADRYATAQELGQALTIEATSRRRDRRTGRRLSRWAIGAGTAVALAVVATGVWMLRQRSLGPAVDPNVIAVMPLRVTGSDTSVRYLREGVLDILYVKLQGGGGLRALDARLILSRLRRRVGEGGDPSPDEALGLARELGAGRVLLGEVVATPTEMLLNARLLRVPDGHVLAEHAASRRPGESELQVLDRALGAVLAGAAGERAERLGSLSDSLSAVLAYLAGMQASRHQEYLVANREFTRALEIDPTFAAAALRLATDGAQVLDADLVRAARDGAWALRDRMTARDRALLEAAVGPRYPRASTGVEFLAAQEAAARLAPDDVRNQVALGMSLEDVGRDRGDAAWAENAAAAYDRAIALDPGDAEALERAMFLAVQVGDTGRVRQLHRAWIATGPTGEYVDATRWVSAAALHDSAALNTLQGRFDEIPWQSIDQLVNISIISDLPVDGILELLEQRDATHTELLAPWRLQLAMVQGRVAKALALLDTIETGAGPSDSLWASVTMVQQAIVDPGYDERAAAAGEWLRVRAETARRPDPLCWSTIWRVMRGDTLGARTAITRIRILVGDRDNLPGPRVSRFDMCPRLLEAMLEQAPAHPDSYAALDWLDSLTRQGIGGWNALPINIAGLFIARWRERQGDYRAARAALARRPTIPNMEHTVVFPASLREEGRLAALAGDTAGAIEAYGRYLNLRTHPDSGPMADAVRRVKQHLAQLVAEHPRQTRR